MKPSFCICGGGALGHVMAGVISSKDYTVHLLTNHPFKWRKKIVVSDIYGKKYDGKIEIISSKPQDVIPFSDIIILCLPGFLIRDELRKIKSFLTQDKIVGSIVASTGFFISALAELGKESKLFSFQRVPFIARISEYGKSANLLGYKNSLNVHFRNVESSIHYLNLFESILNTRINLSNHIFEVTLTNSNPILHPVRLYNLFQDYRDSRVYERQYYFYKEWDNDTSELLISCDNEFQNILKHLSVVNLKIPSLLEYYGVKNAEELTQKLKSIEAFKSILAPMKPYLNGYIPDIESRYFTEDISYGLLLIKYIAELKRLKTPFIDKVLEWGQCIMGKKYMNNHSLVIESSDIRDISCLDHEIISFLINE